MSEDFKTRMPLTAGDYALRPDGTISVFMLDGFQAGANWGHSYRQTEIATLKLALEQSEILRTDIKAKLAIAVDALRTIELAPGYFLEENYESTKEEAISSVSCISKKALAEISGTEGEK